MNNKEDKEIDIIELLIKFIIFLKRRFILLLIITIIGTTLGFVKVSFEKKKYEYKIIGNSYVVPNTLLYQLISSLKDIFQNNNDLFYTELDLPKNISGKITKIDIDTLSFSNNKWVRIILQSNDSSIFGSLKNSLVNYINNNHYIKEEYKFLLNQKMLIAAELDKKLNELDSLLKNIRNTSVKEKSQIAIINSYYSEYINLYDKKQTNDLLLKRLNNIFNIYTETIVPLKNKIILKTVISFLISVFISFLIVSMLELNKQIKKYKKFHLN